MLPLIVRLAQGPWFRRIRVLLPDCGGKTQNKCATETAIDKIMWISKWI